MEEDLEQREQADALDGMLSRLPAESREVLILHDMEGMKLEAIARKLAVTVPVVRRRLDRARAEMRDLLQEEVE